MKQTATMFHFRAVDIKDEEGKVIGKTPKPDSIELQLKSLEVDDVLSIIEKGGKGVEFLLETLNDAIYREARNIVSDAMDAKKVVDQALIDANSTAMDWETIANKPKAERRGNGISEDDWKAFAEDYKAVMAIVLPNKTAEQIATAATHLAAKFSKCRFNKEVIEALRGYLASWFANTPNKEDFATVFEALDNRAETLLAADNTSKLKDAI